MIKEIRDRESRRDKIDTSSTQRQKRTKSSSVLWSCLRLGLIRRRRRRRRLDIVGEYIPLQPLNNNVNKQQKQQRGRRRKIAITVKITMHKSKSKHQNQMLRKRKIGISI
ncbi:MAG: hypothetical protein ACI8RD_012658, partial [Bacillariaceae sp.]